MQFVKKSPSFKPSSQFLPVLPLVPIKIPTDEKKDKTKYITFELKVKAGPPANGPTYKIFVQTFDEGTPQEWMAVLENLNSIWRQNTITGPTDRAATVAVILKGDSLTAFETAMEDARVDPDPNQQEPVAMTNEHVEKSLRAVTTKVFPFRALEIQRQWMIRTMKKPYDLSTADTASALSRLNNYLPSFPEGTVASKFSEQELIGLLEWSLPHSWRKQMDLKGFIPSLGTKRELIEHCERIERNESTTNDKEKRDNNNNKNNKKNKFAKFENNNKKNGGENVPTKDGSFMCKRCGQNATHDTDRCYILKNLARKAEQANGNGKEHAKPFSKRTFRKEINAIARKAGKNDGLAVFASALKREQGKLAKRSSKKHVKATATKKKAAESSESDSDSDESVHILEQPIPRKSTFKATLKAQKNKKSIFADLMEAESSDEDKNMAEDMKPTAEEKAFFDLIDKEEAEEKKQTSKKSCSSNEEAD
jgi:hypothetical protein